MKVGLAVAAVALLIGIIAPATLLELKARRRLSALGQQNPWRVYVLGPFAGQQYFTPEGWRYHTRATLLGILGGVVFLALVLLAFRYGF